MFVKDAKKFNIPAGGTQDFIFRNLTLTTLLINGLDGMIEARLYKDGKIIQLIEKMNLADLIIVNRFLKAFSSVPLSSVMLGSIQLEDLDQLIITIHNNTLSPKDIHIGVTEEKITQSYIYQYNVIKQNSFSVKGCVQIFTQDSDTDEINIEVPGFKVSNTLESMSLLTLLKSDEIADNIIFKSEIPLDVKVDTDFSAPNFIVTKVDTVEKSKNAHIKYSKVVNSNSVANKLVKVGALPQPIHYNQMEA